MAAVADITWTVNTSKGSLTVTKVHDLRDRANASVNKTLFSAADEIIVSDGAESYTQLSVAASRILGKKSTGNLAALTAAEVSVILGSNQSAGMGREGGGSQSINSSTWTKLDWNSSPFSDNGIVSDFTTDDDFTILVTGTYEISLWVRCSSVLVNALRLSWDKNGDADYGSHYRDYDPKATTGEQYHATWAVDLTAGDAVSLWAFHTEGVARTFMGNIGNQCWIKRIG